VIAVEGYIDVIAMTAAASPMSSRRLGTALTPEQCALLWRMAEEPILCFDGDKAGLKAADRAIDTALPLIGPAGRCVSCCCPAARPGRTLRSGGAGALEQAMSAPLPLVEMVWRRETQERSLDTPERRAAWSAASRRSPARSRTPRYAAITGKISPRGCRNCSATSLRAPGSRAGGRAKILAEPALADQAREGEASGARALRRDRCGSARPWPIRRSSRASSHRCRRANALFYWFLSTTRPCSPTISRTLRRWISRRGRPMRCAI